MTAAPWRILKPLLFVLTPNVFSAACRVQGIVRERRLSHTDIRVYISEGGVYISEGGRLSHTDIRVCIYIRGREVLTHKHPCVYIRGREALTHRHPSADIHLHT